MKIDLTGKIYSYFTVIGDSGKRGADRSIYWNCRCICGKICTRTKAVLESPGVHSCGCQRWRSLEDLSGQKFNMLTVIKLDEEKTKDSRLRYWICKCDCGNITSVITANLKSGDVKSCGCYVKRKRIEEMIGRRYGKLVVFDIDEEESNKNEEGYCWKCKCDCGKEITVSTHNLTMGYTRSCGCGHLSQGESIIFSILKENNINFKYDFTYFKDLIVGDSQTKRSLGRYDFIIFDNEKPIRLIEYDGEGHYENFRFLNNHRNLDGVKRADLIKNEYAKQHNIPLVRIPYWEKKNITLEMLMGDQYLVT